MLDPLEQGNSEGGPTPIELIDKDDDGPLLITRRKLSEDAPKSLHRLTLSLVCLQLLLGIVLRHFSGPLDGLFGDVGVIARKICDVRGAKQPPRAIAMLRNRLLAIQN
ncbi:hypothetical protein [Cupriavidus plantarum]|uniref:hypothetical protein n=1 Tax=Cupriavidus plantarum TaxID=942865 RepID=UPI00339D98DE